MSQWNGTAALRLSVHVHPGSRRDEVGGDYDGALVVRVRARAVNGAASDETLRAIARAFGLPRSGVELVHGHRSRTKILELTGDESVLSVRLAELRRDVR